MYVHREHRDMIARSTAESRRNLKERCGTASMFASTYGRPAPTSAQSKGWLQYEARGLLHLQSRSGIHWLTRAMAIDNSECVRCNGVAPGWIDCDINVDLIRNLPIPRFRPKGSEVIHPVGARMEAGWLC
ncbi:hypothetical protein MPL3356_340172 [Mesorhizobium plurifarium]|uniref:Uncharacterized protein n=1 Tax=Mesorhizobium plurifarium TaxID=69974 RepID=A0A090DVM8_MESPL|nr:hypothetical protein MPL3356_340172 [Mesorhizobium plurifarium]